MLLQLVRKIIEFVIVRIIELHGTAFYNSINSIYYVVW
jgi:hypothetical protein